MTKTLFDETWVVIPGYNEENSIPKVLKAVLQHTPRVIYIDDGSSDTSAQKAAQFPVYVLRHEVNLGKGAALQTGCDYAFSTLKAKAVILMDSDGQHNPSEITLFRRKLEEKNDLVLGVRSLRGSMPLERKIGNFFVSGMLFVFFGRYIPDVLSGFKAFTQKAYADIQWKAQDYSVELEIATQIARKRLDFSQVSIETIYHSLDRGMNFLDALKVGGKIVLLRLGL